MSVYKSRIKQKLRDEADSVLTDIIDWKDKPVGLLYARETMQRNVLDIVKYRAQGEKINQMYFEPVQIHEAQATRFKNDMRSMVANMKISTEVKKGDKISESAATQIVGEAMDAIGQLGKIKGNMKIGGMTAEQWQGVIDSVFAENPSLDPNKIRSNVESFRKIYDDLFQKMNEVRLQFGYEPVPYRTGYFPHFSEETVDNMLVRMGFGIGVELNADALPTSINGLTSQFKPGIQWFGNALERKSDKTTYDAVKGFDKYIEGVANVIYHTEDIQKLRALESQIRYLSTDDGIRKQVDAVRDDNRLTDEEKEDKISRIYEHGRFTLAYLFNDTYEKFTGRRPAMDPLGILNDTVGDFTGYQLPNVWDATGDLISGEGINFNTKKENGQKVLQNLAENVAGQMPFSSVLYGGRVPVSSAIPSFDNLTKLNNEDIADVKKRQIALTEAQKLGYVVAPFGYGQLQKSWKGVKALLDGGSYTVNNEGQKQLQYPIFKEDMTPGQVLQAAVMGKSSLPQAKQWAENGYKGLNAKQTALYQDLIDAGTKDKVAYDVIQKMAEAEKTEEKSKNQNMLEVLLGMDLSPKARAMTYERSIDKSKTKTFMEENRDNEEVYTTAPEVENAQAKENETVTIAKIREIQRADISDDAKAALYYGMVASDETRELMDKMTDEGASGAEVAKTLMQIQNADRLKGTEKSTAKRNAIADSNLEEEHKLELYREKISDDKEDEISQFRAAGMDLDTFIEVQNEYSRIKDTGKKESQQAQDFSYWLEKQNLTDRQKKTARECFTFYSMVPQDAKYFNQAVEAGVDADKAYDVINKMTALKPLPGRTSVSDAQKLRVIVDSGMSEKDMVKMIQSSGVTNTMKTRLPILLDNGVSIKKQLQFWEAAYNFDADGSGKLNQREVRACLDSFPGGNNNPLEALMGITSSSGPAWTTAEKAAMWQSYNKQFSARKNPYDRKVGEKVKADIKAAGKKDEEPEKTQTGQVSTGMSAWSTGNAELDRMVVFK